MPRWLSEVLPEQARFRGQDQATVLLQPERTVDGPDHREIDRTERMLGCRHKEEQQSFSVTIKAEQKGPAQPGLLSRMFGAPPAEIAGPVTGIVDVDVIDTVEVVSSGDDR